MVSERGANRMTVALQLDGVDDFLTYTNWSATGDFTISGRFESGPLSGTGIILGRTSDTGNYLALYASGNLQVSVGGSASGLLSGILANTVYNYTITRVGTLITLTAETGFITHNSSNTFNLNALGKFSAGAFFAGQYRDITTLSRSGDIRTLDVNSSSTGAGTPVITDTTSSLDATGVNMPTAALGQPGSAWIDLGGSGVTVTALLNSNYMVEYSMKKNVASQSIGAQMVTISDGSDFTGTVTAEVTIDNGTKTAGGGSVTHEGEGYHSYAPTQAETNGDHIAVSFAGTGALTQTIQVYTTFPQTVDNATGIADIPTVSEFNARTIASGDYFDPAADTVANVTLVATTTTNTDMVGTNGANTVVPPSVSQFNARTVVSADYFLVTDYTAPDNAGITQTQADIAALNDISVSQILTTQMTESYAGDGVAPTLAQSLFLTMQNLQDYTYVGTVQTVKKLDGSATAATYTLDDAVNPTSKTRAT